MQGAAPVDLLVALRQQLVWGHGGILGPVPLSLHNLWIHSLQGITNAGLLPSADGAA